MRNALAIIPALLLAACTTAPWARFTGGPGFRSLDTDGDGVISRQEAAKVSELARNFDRLDTNHNQSIGPAEYAAATAYVQRIDFTRLDLNGDGVISEREAASMPASLHEVFRTVDADRDGNISKAEYKAATVNLLERVDFAAVDTDGDGVLSSNEVRNHPLLMGAFDRMDINGDGLVSRSEFEAAKRR